MSSSPETPTRTRPPIAVVVFVVLLVQFLLVLLFAWPAARTAPRNVPLGISGPPQVVTQVTGGIGHAMPGAFTFTTYADGPAAQQAVTSRKVYASLVFTQQGATLFTASAASPTLANALTQAIPSALKAAQPQLAVTVTDLVPPPASDPHGASLPSALIPLTITSIAAGALISLSVKRRAVRLGSVIGFAIGAGLFVTLALQTMVGGLAGSFIANASVLALFALAVAATTAGLTAALGLIGTGVTAFVVFFFGFPYSGATSAWQMLPTPWGATAQYLPVGAANQAVRSVAFFSSAGAGIFLGVLALWAVVGLALAAIPRAFIGAGSDAN